MINYNGVAIEPFIDRLIALTKNSKISWGLIKDLHYEMDSFPEWVASCEKSKGLLLYDSVYTKHGDGFILLLHFAESLSLGEGRGSLSINNVYAITPGDTSGLVNPYYALAIQPISSLVPETLDFSSKEFYQEKFYVLHQLALRKIGSIDDFIDQFMQDTKEEV